MDKRACMLLIRKQYRVKKKKKEMVVPNNQITACANKDIRKLEGL